MASTKAYTIPDVDKVLENVDGTIKKFEIARLTAPGENFRSLVFRVDFEIEKDGKTSKVSVVAKRLPLTLRKDDSHAVIMKTEIMWYRDLLPMVKEAGKELGIEADFYPKYLGGRLSLDPTQTEADKESVLLLENLIPQGYRNEDRYVGFDLPASKAVLKILAAFHALPLVAKFKKPDFFKSIQAFLERGELGRPKMNKKDGPPRLKPDRKPPQQQMIQKLLEDPACQPYKANLEKLTQNSRGPPSWHKSGKEPWNTIVHTNYWVNNLMVKPVAGGEPLVKMVDFQTCSYSSYGKDLVFLLLSSVRNDVLKEQLDDLLRYYYDQLTSHLSKANIPELKLSYDDYLEEVKRVAQESEIDHVFMFSAIVFGPKGTGPDVLMGEGDGNFMQNIVNNMSELLKEKLLLVTEICVKKGWI